jgi:C4-dicarboxylate-specific signal transduction histidine kinase
MTNAVDAMEESPRKVVTVCLSMASPDELTVSVSDSGPGIHETIKGTLFKPFMTTKEKGLGIGLRICRTIVEDHGGRSWRERDTGDGATFSFALKAYPGGSE